MGYQWVTAAWRTFLSESRPVLTDALPGNATLKRLLSGIGLYFAFQICYFDISFELGVWQQVAAMKWMQNVWFISLCNCCKLSVLLRWVAQSNFELNIVVRLRKTAGFLQWLISSFESQT